ncbi:NLP/P60 protein [Fictibacillus macauensis ZFHKF-1]|uniref:NLP/P60 protein n=1 Tax=Fictibacillus macauensis ZFHKF-1 TaxID=1196324 RepID=I8UAH7_9BACL|nr:C40 family peptidase [Fictibacillus macauensis]EIT83813.1 NLP/P60 protein [Fictibacillus macauensis ZFHKF-1]
MKKVIVASIVSLSLLSGAFAPSALAAKNTPSYTTEKGADKALAVAMSNIGKKYQHGGMSPTGFDASGLLAFAYKKGAKLTIPRTIAKQYKTGKVVVDKHMKKGDMVFFDLEGKKKPTFVGLYAGKGKVIAATMKGVRTFTIKAGYWKDKVLTVKRLAK